MLGKEKSKPLLMLDCVLMLQDGKKAPEISRIIGLPLDAVEELIGTYYFIFAK